MLIENRTLRSEPYQISFEGNFSIKYCMYFLQTLFCEKSELMATIHSKLAGIQNSYFPNQVVHFYCSPKPTIVLLYQQQADAMHKTKQKHSYKFLVLC